MSEREEAGTCVRCGVTDTAVLDLDTGSACHPEWRDCVSALRYFLREQDSDLFTLRQQLTTAERERDEARRVIERIKAIRLSPLCCDGENNAEVDAYHDGFNAAMEEVHEAVRALDAAEGTP